MKCFDFNACGMHCVLGNNGLTPKSQTQWHPHIECFNYYNFLSLERQLSAEEHPLSKIKVLSMKSKNIL